MLTAPPAAPPRTRRRRAPPASPARLAHAPGNGGLRPGAPEGAGAGRRCVLPGSGRAAGRAPRRRRRGREVLDIGNMNDWQKKTPLDWETYLNKMVKVAAIEKHEYEGWVLTVDPISASIVLATFLENEKVSISVVLGHAVQEVKILKEGDDEMKQRLAGIFAPEESKAYSPAELEKRKNDLKTWLEANHIPVTEQQEGEL
ncbi:gem-associated protein 6 isoform X2 [Falco biarmicus]|uniref:gem-associated protein 6 isoform X2 n=2 Tax=Falco TaxID=8952 RepID=UPI0024BC345E|nr:gem-associated protein 6 isoform X2 [Falco biarmicus]